MYANAVSSRPRNRQQSRSFTYNHIIDSFLKIRKPDKIVAMTDHSPSTKIAGLVDKEPDHPGLSSSAAQSDIGQVSGQYSEQTQHMLKGLETDLNEQAARFHSIPRYDPDKDNGTFGENVEDRLEDARRKGWDKLLQDSRECIDNVNDDFTTLDPKTSARIWNSLKLLCRLYEGNTEQPSPEDEKSFYECYTTIVFDMIGKGKTAPNDALDFQTKQPQRGNTRRTFSSFLAFVLQRKKKDEDDPLSVSSSSVDFASRSSSPFERRGSIASMNVDPTASVSPKWSQWCRNRGSRRSSLASPESHDSSRRGSVASLSRRSTQKSMGEEEARERITEQKNKIKDALQEMTRIYKKYEKDDETVPSVDE